jgi:hypothetical protein
MFIAFVFLERAYPPWSRGGTGTFIERNFFPGVSASAFARGLTLFPTGIDGRERRGGPDEAWSIHRGFIGQQCDPLFPIWNIVFDFGSRNLISVRDLDFKVRHVSYKERLLVWKKDAWHLVTVHKVY